MQITVTIPEKDISKITKMADEKRLSLPTMARLLMVERLDQIEDK